MDGDYFSHVKHQEYIILFILLILILIIQMRISSLYTSPPPRIAVSTSVPAPPNSDCQYALSPAPGAVCSAACGSGTVSQLVTVTQLPTGTGAKCPGLIGGSIVQDAPCTGTFCTPTLSYPIMDSYVYLDIDPTVAPWNITANYVLDPGNPSWSNANANCWSLPNCTGIRHNFDTGQTWYLKQTVDSTIPSSISVNNPVVTYNGSRYSLPLSIVASRSTRNPNPLVLFTNVGTTTWTVPAGVTSVWVLVVGGGGSGGSSWTFWNETTGAIYITAGGGGGGGGVIEKTTYSVTPGTPISITVGAGGSGYGGSTSGGNSQFGTLIAYGGGANGNSFTNAPPPISTKNGGSGAGGTGYLYNYTVSPDGGVTGGTFNSNGGGGTTGQGYAGGSGFISAPPAQALGGGGGGGGGIGGNATGATIGNCSGGVGGAGYKSSITGAAVYYAGGGGGGGAGTDRYRLGGTGGTGGGGTGGGGLIPANVAFSDATYYGGGGGGQAMLAAVAATPTVFKMGAGYQGIVIVKYN